MKRISAVLLLTALFLFNGVGLSTAEERPLHEIHSMLMFNFVKYIEWPSASQKGEFTITVVGDKDVYSTLTNFYANRDAKGQPVKITFANSAAEVSNAHIVYLADEKSGEFDAIQSKVSGKPTLLITDKSGLGKKGSCINFKEVGGKLKFEINQSSFSANNLKISSQLASMGITI